VIRSSFFCLSDAVPVIFPDEMKRQSIKETFEFSKIWIGSFFYPVFQKIRTRLTPLPTNVDQLSSYGDTVNLKTFSYGSCFMADLPAAPRPGRPLPIFTPFRGFYPLGTD